MCAAQNQKRATAGTVTNRKNCGNCVRTRVGIELTPVASRIVEVVHRGRIWRTPGIGSSVVSFGMCPASEPDLDDVLQSLRGKTASVVVWGTASEHRQVDVHIGSYGRMRAEALRTLSDDGVPTRGVWADIAPAGPADGVRMPVVVSAASAKQMTDALQPLTDAGIRLRTVMTPAAALAAIARSRRAFSAPDTTEAYVALDNTLTCVALTRNGALVAAHDLAWGFLHDDEKRRPRARDEIVSRLSHELAELFKMSSDAGRVTQVCICGGLPDLRSITLPLLERLDVEVEILDSLSGIDVGSLSQPAADEVRERVSELRIAWVAAAEWTTISLLRPNRRRASQAALSRAAVVAGVAAGLGSGWSIARIDSLPVAAASPVPTRSAPARAAVEALSASPSLPSEASPTATAGTLLAKEEPTAPAPPPIKQEPAVARFDPPSIDEIRERVLAPPPISSEPPPIRQEPPAAVRRVAPEVVPRRVQRSAPQQPPPPLRRPASDPPPFDAAISSILFSADRQLAIIDGRVVGRGDMVRDATVVEISADIVLLRDAQGRLRRLSTGGASR
jgi:hypothetical protein